MPQFTGVSSRKESKFEAFTEAADLFAGSTVEKATKKSREASYRPINSNSEGPFDFYIPHEGDLYLNPSTLRLHGGFKVVIIENGVEKPLPADKEVSLVNLAPLSFFKSLEIDFQGQIVSFINTPLHHYKSYIETILSYDSNVQATHLKAALWEADTAGKFDKLSDGAQSGYTNRKAWIKESKINYFSIDLHSDLACTEKFWPNKLDVNIRLNRAPDTFSLLAPKPKEVGGVTPPHPTYKIVFTDLVLTIDKVQLEPATLAKHESSFNQGGLANYPYSKTVLKTKQISKGLTYAKIENLFMNELPNSCVVAMVDSEAFNGKLELNPFNFQHFNLTHLQFDYNSEIIPPNGIRPNFTTGDYMKEYRRLFDHTGVGTGNITNNITPDYFKGGMTLFPVDFTPDKCLGYHTHTTENGSLGLELKFAKELEKSITVIVFATFDDVIELDASRQVIFRKSTHH